MNNRLGIYFFRVWEYLKYYLRADTIYSIDSPWLTNFFREVLDDTRRFYAFGQIDALRSKLENDHSLIIKKDYGAGSLKDAKLETTISKIATTSGVSKYKGELLFRIASYFKSRSVLELGTNLGLSASYLASYNSDIKVITIEGDEQLHHIAKENFEFLKIYNIELVLAHFDDVLPNLLDLNSFDLVFIDGNHTFESTINYFNQCRNQMPDQFLIVLDDIYWNSEMKRAWDTIKETTDSNLILDLYHFGLVGNLSILKKRIKKTLIPSRFKILKPGIFR